MPRRHVSLVRSAGWAAAGCTAGAFAAGSFIGTNASIVGAHDALVVVAICAAIYGAGASVASLCSALARAAWRRWRPARPAMECSFAAALIEGSLFAALAVALDAAASLLPGARPRALDLVATAAVAFALVHWISPRIAGARRWTRSVVAAESLLFLGAVAGAVAVASRPPAEPAAALAAGVRAGPVFLIGLDGADWRRIDALAAAGRLPTFAKLIEEGVRAPLATRLPTWSPRLWTTIATGCAPEVHGVLDFTETPVPGLERGIQRLRKEPLLPRFGGVRDLVAAAFRARLLHEVPVTACQRRAPALWNVLSACGRRVAVVNWYATWPAEPVQGAIVSDNNPRRAAYLLAKHGALASGASATTYPEGLMVEIADLDALDPGDDPEAVVNQRFFADLSDAKRQSLAQREHYLHTFRVLQTTDAFAIAAAEHLLATDRPDFLAVYLSGVDNVSHRNFREPSIIDRYYEYTDALLHRIVARADDATTIVLVSDHGWEYADGREVGHEHGPDGVFLAWGAGVRGPARLARTPRIEDVAPTILAMFGLPRSAAMEGTPILEALPAAAATGPAMQVVRSFGPYSAPARPAAGSGAAVRSLEEEGLQRLRELGYVK